MATPIIEIILEKVATALEAITVGNGYQVTVASVYRPQRLGAHDRATAGSYTVALVMDTPARLPELDVQAAEPVITWAQPVLMDLVYRPSDRATTAIETALTTFWADVVRALMANPQWDGYAHDSLLSAPETWIDQEGGECGMSARLEIVYRVKEADPYQLPWNPPAWRKVIDGGAANTTDYDIIIEGNGA